MNREVGRWGAVRGVVGEKHQGLLLLKCTNRLPPPLKTSWLFCVNETEWVGEAKVDLLRITAEEVQ